jgi:hypothetical protein
MKKEQTSKPAKSQRSVQREMKEVLAELVEKQEEPNRPPRSQPRQNRAAWLDMILSDQRRVTGHTSIAAG